MKTDRRVAISGLEARIACALGCKSRYGIFEKYLHRNLLWQPSDIEMEEIVYKTQHVPSWSWMAYSGGIQFMEIPFGEVSWIAKLRFDEQCACDHAIIAGLASFQNCTMKLHGEHYMISDQGGTKRGWIQYDFKNGEKRCKGQCIVLGKTNINGVKEYYIIVVKPTRVDGEYRRAGVGIIYSGCVLRRGIDVRVV